MLAHFLEDASCLFISIFFFHSPVSVGLLKFACLCFLPLSEKKKSFKVKKKRKKRSETLNELLFRFALSESLWVKGNISTEKH